MENTVKIEPSPNEITLYGKTYDAQDITKGCQGCAADVPDEHRLCILLPECTAPRRTDNRYVVWVLRVH
jgi:hypothetical protein